MNRKILSAQIKTQTQTHPISRNVYQADKHLKSRPLPSLVQAATCPGQQTVAQVSKVVYRSNDLPLWHCLHQCGYNIQNLRKAMVCTCLAIAMKTPLIQKFTSCTPWPVISQPGLSPYFHLYNNRNILKVQRSTQKKLTAQNLFSPTLCLRA